MINLNVVIGLFVLHFLADFVFQSNKMAQNKSSSNFWLGAHVLVYTLFMFPIGIIFAIVNGILHFTTDYFTSRLSKRMWNEKKVHEFFVVIGFDQMVHMISLVLTYYFLIP